MEKPKEKEQIDKLECAKNIVKNDDAKKALATKINQIGKEIKK